MSTNPLRKGLIDHTVKASVVSIEHFSAGVSVDTQYDINVRSVSGDGSVKSSMFYDFKIGKKFKSFRDLASKLRKAASAAKKDSKEKKQDPSEAVGLMIKTAETVSRLVESEKTRYFGKVSYEYCKDLAKKRQGIIEDVFESILLHFPQEELENPFISQFVQVFEEFLLTDHIVEEDQKKFEYAKTERVPGKRKSVESPTVSPKKVGNKDEEKFPPVTAPKTTKSNEHESSSVIMPITTTKSVTFLTEDDLKEKTFHLAEAKSPSQAVLQQKQVQPTALSKTIQRLDDPKIFVVFFGVGVYALRTLSDMTITIDSDIAVLIAFLSFCIGVHSPRLVSEEVVLTPVAQTKARPALAREDDYLHQSSSALIQRSMLSSRGLRNSSKLASTIETFVADEVVDGVKSPMPLFPEGAKLGTVMNCWSKPESTTFSVRGPKYLTDKKKIPSGPFLFPARGIDLFLTDDCPEDVGRNAGAFGGKLREKPTFIVNFRLPWAVLLCYFEIPELYLPFLRKRYESSSENIELPSMEKMSPGERTAAQFLMGDDNHKDSTLKIVPVAVDAPWVVRSVVTGKPAILGKKLPVTYVYHPADEKKGHAAYLEADLDIVASAAARRILGVVRGYTNVLTLDLGFVIQGNTTDELPEQMLVGARLHSIDPLTAPPLPPMPEIDLNELYAEDGNESD